MSEDEQTNNTDSAPNRSNERSSTRRTPTSGVLVARGLRGRRFRSARMYGGRNRPLMKKEALTDTATALKPWMKGGPSPNYRGRGKGTPNKFSQQLVADFAADWRAHGAAAIARLREESVVAYVKIAASLVPREMLLQISRPMAEMTDESCRPRRSKSKRQARKSSSTSGLSAARL